MDMALPAKFRNDPTLYADGPDEVRRMVRRQVREGVDGFKTAISGGLGGRMEEVWWKKYSDEELLALTDTAHGVGKLVAVHAHTDESIRQGLRCNVDTIEHGVYIKSETAAQLAERAIPLVPTLAVKSGRALERAKAAGAVSPHQLRKRQELINAQGQVIQTAHNAGVLIATGSDAYFTLRGDYWGLNNEEISLLMDAGLPPLEALKAGTLNAAQAVGMGDDIGAIAPGRFADLVAFTRSPLENPDCLTDPDSVALVILNGELVAGSSEALVKLLPKWTYQGEHRHA
jgi:imidazolonepropionase-like amidohydrolase